MKNENTIPILELLIHTAKGFYDVCFNCGYNLNKDNKITSLQRIAPAAVNMSFAAELFLKAVHLIVNKKNTWGHELLKLFEELPQTTQYEIENRFNDYLKNNQECKFLPAYQMVVSIGDSKTENKIDKDNDKDLTEFLKMHNLTFHNWRYIHEVKEMGYFYESDLKTMDCFLKSLIDCINTNMTKIRDNKT